MAGYVITGAVCLVVGLVAGFTAGANLSGSVLDAVEAARDAAYYLRVLGGRVLLTVGAVALVAAVVGGVVLLARAA